MNSKQVETWFQSPRGAYVQKAQGALVRHMVASWKRRDHLLLEIGIGAGHNLSNLWECGFDVTGIEDNQELFEKAKKVLGNKAHLLYRELTHLPFDDQSFDYVVLSSALLTKKPIEPLLDEAFRLATKGILLFWKNSFSLHGICNKAQKLPSGQELALQQYSPLKILNLVKKRSPQIKFRSILFAPSCTWRHIPYFFAFNSLKSPLPLGAFVCLRIDKGQTIPLSKTPLFTQKSQLVGALSQE